MKTEIEIEKEKEAVAKMIGAKSAMQLMIDRHDTLVSALRFTEGVINDLGKHVGEDLFIRTFHHDDPRDTGAKFVQVRAQLSRVSDRVSSLIK